MVRCSVATLEGCCGREFSPWKTRRDICAVVHGSFFVRCPAREPRGEAVAGKEYPRGIGHWGRRLRLSSSVESAWILEGPWLAARRLLDGARSRVCHPPPRAACHLMGRRGCAQRAPFRAVATGQPELRASHEVPTAGRFEPPAASATELRSGRATCHLNVTRTSLP